MKITKKKLRKIIREEIKLNEDTFDDDMKAARKMRKNLESVFDSIDMAVEQIDKNLSEFNSPGLSMRFLTAIVKGAEIKKNFTFNKRVAMRVLAKYYDEYR